MKTIFGAIFLSVVSVFQGPGEVTLDAGEHTLESLVKTASETLRINYVISQESRANLGKKVQVTARRSFSAKEFRSFFEKTLLDGNCVLDPIQGVDGGQFRLVDLRASPASRATIVQSATVVTPDQLEALEGRAILVTTAFSLQFSDAQRVQGSLRQYLSDTMIERLFNIGSNVLVVTSYPSTVQAIAKFLRVIDVAPSPEMQEIAIAQGLPQRVILLERRVRELELKLQEVEKK